MLTGTALWFFFGPKRTGRADLADRAQFVRIQVQGGYGPDLVVVTRAAGAVNFDRQDSGRADPAGTGIGAAEGPGY